MSDLKDKHCGPKPPVGKRKRGTVAECIKKKQVSYYGVKCLTNAAVEKYFGKKAVTDNKPAPAKKANSKEKSKEKAKSKPKPKVVKPKVAKKKAVSKKKIETVEKETVQISEKQKQILAREKERNALEAKYNVVIKKLSKKKEILSSRKEKLGEAIKEINVLTPVVKKLKAKINSYTEEAIKEKKDPNIIKTIKEYEENTKKGKAAVIERNKYIKLLDDVNRDISLLKEEAIELKAKIKKIPVRITKENIDKLVDELRKKIAIRVAKINQNNKDISDYNDEKSQVQKDSDKYEELVELINLNKKENKSLEQHIKKMETIIDNYKKKLKEVLQKKKKK